MTSALSRREFLATAAAGALAAQASRAGAAPAKRPNILFLLTDDQRWDAVGYAGNPIIQTPNLDKLATDGVNFTRSYVTTSICMASRASILTGQYTSKHGIDDFAKPLDSAQFAQTYPALLREAGYFTGFVGKWGLGGPLPEEGFDYFDGFSGQGHFFQEVDGETRHLTGLLGESTVKAMRACPGDQPFCLSVSFKAPHVQDQDPKQYLYDPVLADLYEDDEIPPAPASDPDYVASLPDFIRESEGRRRWEMRFATPEAYQTSVKGYYRLMTGVDRAVGTMTAALEELGLADNTIIIFTSDNGILNGEHGLAGKWFMYEESIRIPLFIHDPRLPAAARGRSVDAQALSIDFAPTMLAMAGLPTPAGMQGESLTPFLEGAPDTWRESWYYEHHFGSRGREVRIPANEGVHTGDWKYVRWVDEEPLFEQLFDLRNDPHEMHNLAGDPDQAARLEAMRAQWADWRERVKH